MYILQVRPRVSSYPWEDCEDLHAGSREDLQEIKARMEAAYPNYEYRIRTAERTSDHA